MKVELIKSLNYDKLKKILSNETDKSEELIDIIKQLEKERRIEIVSSAGRLSRYPKDVFEVLNLSQSKTAEQNQKFSQMVIGLGHTSITEHDYCLFAIKDVSPVIEQIIIAERFSSFTIKSRREVDFSNVGFYTPDFHDKAGNIITNNQEVKREYQEYMMNLFAQYQKLEKAGIPKEDARFILPYSYHSNIIMGIDAHTLRDMIEKFTKTKYANIQEVRQFGERLYEIAKENIPYIIESIDRYQANLSSSIDDYIKDSIDEEKYQVLSSPKMINHSLNIDDTILISSLMRRYQYDYGKAKRIYEKACRTKPGFKEELIKKIAFESDKLELAQVNFEFQIPLSYAVLTHLTRHRTHPIMVPDFTPVGDLSQYKIPPKIKNTCEEQYKDIFNKNVKMYKHFKEDYGIRDEDLIYFTLSGNMVNIITNFDGKTLEHILRLRECNKTQWETRQMAYDIHKEIDKLEDAKYFSSILGSTCVTQGICNEGKECCGKVYALQKNKGI